MKPDSKSDLEQLAQYVAVHPEDNEHRWTLAKKLYMAWEYNDALKHLLILKKNWTTKLNVLRYLAATYYRLGLYDEAIDELLAITRRWPSEVAVWEQLARVYEVAGRTADAAHTWEEVVRVNPSHPTAARSVQRLRLPAEDVRREDLRLRDSDSGIDMSPYRVCKSCGAQNSDEFDRCWQCHAALRDEGPVIDSMHAARPRKSLAWMLTFAGGMSTVASLSLGVYIALITLRRTRQDLPSGNGPVYDLLASELFVSRLVCAGLLAIAWPLALWVSFRITGAQNVRWSQFAGAGGLLASITYLSMWLPVAQLVYAPLLPAAASLIVMLALGAPRFAQTIAAWILHGVLVLLVGFGSFIALSGTEPIRQLQTIALYSDVMSALPNREYIQILAAENEGARFVKWEPTESSWLNRHGRTIRIDAVPDEPDRRVQIEIFSGDVQIGEDTSKENTVVAAIVPGQPYRVTAVAEAGGRFVLRSRGVLQPVQASQ